MLSIFNFHTTVKHRFGMPPQKSSMTYGFIVVRSHVMSFSGCNWYYIVFISIKRHSKIYETATFSFAIHHEFINNIIHVFLAHYIPVMRETKKSYADRNCACPSIFMSTVLCYRNKPRRKRLCLCFQEQVLSEKTILSFQLTLYTNTYRV